MSLLNKIELWDIPQNFYFNNKLDKLSVSRHIDFPIFKVPSLKVKEIMKIFRKFCPDLINFDNILKYPNDEHKGIILDPSKAFSIDEKLNEEEKKTLQKLNCEFLRSNLETINKCVTYDNYKLSTLLEWILPKDNLLSGFTVVGHIVHINLKEDLNLYKYVIGELILDKVPRINCVVSKLNTIETEFRTFTLDLLAGEPDYITTVKENGFEFKFDFSKVYWNSRLGTEHQRIIDELQANDVVYDACAGVGPFAIPAAKKGCRVVANDLNDESCKWFRENLKLNSSKRNKLSIDLHNKDASEFIHKVVLTDIIETNKTTNVLPRFYLIMNLPSIAVNFLSSILNKSTMDLMKSKNIILSVRCYCFIGKAIPKEEIETKIHDQLGQTIQSLNIRFVRNVAPSKDMYCAEIDVNLSGVSAQSTEEVSPKRMKMNSVDHE